MNMCSILLVEDHRILAQSLVTALSQRGPFHIAGVVESAEEAMQQLPSLRVDLALVDVVLPRISGIELVLSIRRQYPRLPCLMISGRSAPHYVSRSLSAGANGYVLKDDIHDVIQGIRHVMNGKLYLSQPLLVGKTDLPL